MSLISYLTNLPTPKITKENRKQICDSCEYKKEEFKTLIQICSKCGCVIEAKIRISSQSCPINKW